MSDGAIVISTELNTDDFIQALEGLSALARGAMEQVVGVFTELRDRVVETLQNAKEMLLTAATTWLEGLGLAASRAKELVFTTLGQMITEAVNALLGKVESLLSAATSFFQGLATAVSQKGAACLRALGELITQILNTVIGSAERMLTAALSFFKGIVTAVGGITDDVLTTLGTLISLAVTKVTDGYKEMFEAGQRLASGIWDGITSIASSWYQNISSLVSGLVTSAKNAVTGGFGGVTSFIGNSLSNSGFSVPSNFFNSGPSNVSKYSNTDLLPTFGKFSASSGNSGGITNVNHYNTTYQFAAANGSIADQLRTARAQDQINRLRGGL